MYPIDINIDIFILYYQQPYVYRLVGASCLFVYLFPLLRMVRGLLLALLVLGYFLRKVARLALQLNCNGN